MPRRLADPVQIRGLLLEGRKGAGRRNEFGVGCSKRDGDFRPSRECRQMAALMPRIERPVRLAAIMFGLLAVLSAIVAALVAAFPDPRSPDMMPMKLFAFSLALYF